MSWLLRVCLTGGRLMSRKGRTCCPARKSAKNQKVEQRISSDSSFLFFFSPLLCVTHSLSFPFTLLFRSRPFSPSYVPALFLFLLFLFFSTFLRYANCLECVTSSTNCKWQGLIRFVSQCLGWFHFCLCVGSHDRVKFYILYFLLSFTFFLPSLFFF